MIDYDTCYGGHPQMTDYPIKGIMITTEKEFSDLLFNRAETNSDVIKLDMIRTLAEEIFRANCVEFTHQANISYASRIVRARIFCVPSQDVQLLRTLKS